MISVVQLVDFFKAEPEDEATLLELEAAAVAAVQERTGLYLGTPDEIVETAYLRGGIIALANEPIGGEVTSVEQWDGSAWGSVSTTGYLVDGRLIRFSEAPYSYAPNRRFRVTYEAGFDEAPDDIKQAVRMLVGHWFRNPEAVAFGISAEVELGLSWLLQAHKRVAV